MNLLAKLFGTATGFLSGRLWQVAAIALFATMLASSSYLGYKWHEAAEARDTAVTELNLCKEEKAKLSERIGGLAATLELQNAAIVTASTQTAEAVMRYEGAMEQVNLYGSEVEKLKRRLAAKPKSTTCEGALSRQRQIINELNALRLQGSTP